MRVGFWGGVGGVGVLWTVLRGVFSWFGCLIFVLVLYVSLLLSEIVDSFIFMGGYLVVKGIEGVDILDFSYRVCGVNSY